MLQNYLKIALRNLRRHRVYSALNIAGLGLAVACCLLIFLLVQFQTSFDRFHPKVDRIARVVTDLHLENIRYMGGVPYPLAEALRREFSFVEQVAAVDGYGEVQVSVPDSAGGRPVIFKETDAVAYAEPAIFDILDFPLLKGRLSDFSTPDKALITEKTARKYFGSTEALGRSFQAFGKTFQVCGILRNMPANTDYGREVFCSWASFRSPEELKEIRSWGSIRGSTRCFVLLKAGHTPSELTAALPAFSAEYPHPMRKELFDYRAYSLPAMHFDNRYDGAFDRRYIWVLSGIGLFLLLTACVNFVNMATAQSLLRAKEVGVRKSLGSTRAQLFRQFMLETAVLVVFSFLLGLLTAQALLPLLNTWSGMALQLGALLRPESILFMVLLGALLMLLAGVYPGWVLAGFQPVASLKGQTPIRLAGRFSLRRGLVTGQFALAQVLIFAAVVVTVQMRYALNTDWGFRREALLTVPLPDTAAAGVLKQQLAQIPGIRSLSLCSAPPAFANSNQTFFKFENRSEPEKWAVTFLWADENYLPTFDLQLAAGHNFDPADPQLQCLVNETFVRQLGLGNPADAAGATIRIEDSAIRIAGVVRDFHTGSFREHIPPLLLQNNPGGFSLCALRLDRGNPETTLRRVAETWSRTFPARFYEHHFLDEELAGFYKAETRMLHLVNLFTGITIFIGCLGLFGLTAFMVLRKRKEIGIRKILGASVPGVLWLFGREYLLLIGSAFVVAAPAGWWAMSAWLADFAYRIELSWWMFALAAGVALLVALLTVGVQSARAALVNPANSLQNE